MGSHPWDGNFRIVKLLLVLFGSQVWVNFFEFIGVNANFNFYLDRREFQKLHGISSDIYYVREGVVNEYATSFLVTVPAEVDDLNFSWQALTKKPVYYEMAIDYTDFFALLPPISNISNSGRVPQNLEVFRVSLPCSGRSDAEVSVTIRIVFQVKHPKPNTTTINIKRNKICFLKAEPNPKMTTGGDDMGLVFPAVAVETPNLNPNRHYPPNPSENNGMTFFQDPTPSLLLAGLLGGCIITACAVFLTFFICLRRKLTPLTETGRSTLPAYGSCHGESDPGSSSNNSSPACLLRQNGTLAPNTGVLGTTDGLTNQGSWKHFNTPRRDKSMEPSNSSGSGHNSYITIASFWNDIFSHSGNPTTHNVHLANSQHSHVRNRSPKILPSQTSTKGSDVSPYAYAHIIPASPAPPPPPPLPKIGAPPLIEWYSQFPSTVQLGNNSTVSSYASTNLEKSTPHIYSNNLHTFSPKPKFSSSNSQVSRNSAEYDPVANPTSTINSATGSLIQIDGFQCRRNLAKEENVVERFL